MKTVGVDVFLNCKNIPNEGSPRLPEKLGAFSLNVISNRGTRVWPGPKPQFMLVDVFRCRFVKGDWQEVTQDEILSLLKAIGDLGFNWVHVEKLHDIEGVKAFSVVQGE